MSAVVGGIPSVLSERKACSSDWNVAAQTALRTFVLVVVFVTIQVAGVILSFAACRTDKDTYSSSTRKGLLSFNSQFVGYSYIRVAIGCSCPSRNAEGFPSMKIVIDGQSGVTFPCNVQYLWSARKGHS